jgi:hypothetical protein
MKRLSLTLVVLAVLLTVFANAAAQRAPTGPSVMSSGSGPQGASCTSSNGKSTCVCAAKCQATAIACECYGIPPAPGNADSPSPSVSDLLNRGGRSKATCISGDGKKTCACGDKGCDATPIGCACLTQ